MASQPTETENGVRWLWKSLRKRRRRDLDKIQRDLVKRPGEKREYAGDPNQPRHFWVRTRNR
jgi:hypothetical protein